MKNFFLALFIVFSAAIAQATDTCDEQPITNAPGVFAGVATGLGALVMSPLLYFSPMPVVGALPFLITDLLSNDNPTELSSEELSAYALVIAGGVLIGANYVIASLAILPLLYIINPVGFVALISAAYLSVMFYTLWYGVAAPTILSRTRCKSK